MKKKIPIRRVLKNAMHHTPLRRQLPARVQQMVSISDVRHAGVIDLGMTRVHVIDTPQRALVVRSVCGTVHSFSFWRTSHERIMRRFARLAAHRPFLQGEQP